MNDAHGNEIKIGSIVKPTGHWDYVGRIEVVEFTPTGIRGIRYLDESEVWFAASAVRVVPTENDSNLCFQPVRTMGDAAHEPGVNVANVYRRRDA